VGSFLAEVIGYYQAGTRSDPNSRPAPTEARS
jgi:hypothetical protein